MRCNHPWVWFGLAVASGAIYHPRDEVGLNYINFVCHPRMTLDRKGLRVLKGFLEFLFKYSNNDDFAYADKPLTQAYVHISSLCDSKIQIFGGFTRFFKFLSSGVVHIFKTSIGFLNAKKFKKQ